jgi:hypothetical protein
MFGYDGSALAAGDLLDEFNVATLLTNDSEASSFEFALDGAVR